MKLLDTLKNKKYAIPGILVGIALLGAAGVASAFGGGHGFDVNSLSGFSDSQKSIIQQAFDIRQKADESAQKLLKDNGIDEIKLHKAMRELHDSKRKVVDAALEANDYTTFKTALAGAPKVENITEDIFAKLVEAYKLRKAGDYAEARKIMDSLNLQGFGPGFGMGGHAGMQGGHRGTK